MQRDLSVRISIFAGILAILVMPAGAAGQARSAGSGTAPAAGSAGAAKSMPFRAPPAGTVLVFNGMTYTFRRTRGQRTTVDVQIANRRNQLRLQLQDVFLLRERRVGRQRARNRIIVKDAIWPLTPGASHKYSWVMRIGGQVRAIGAGTIRVFSGFRNITLAGRTWKTILVVKEQSWRTLRGDNWRSRQNLFYAPALGFYVRDERFFFRNDKPLPPVVMRLHDVKRPK